MAIKKEHIHRLVDEIPERELNAEFRYLQYLRDMGEDPGIAALSSAAYDLAPLMADEVKESEIAWNDYIAGKDRGKPFEEYKAVVNGA